MISSLTIVYAGLIIIYICLGLVLILADSMTVQLTAKGVFNNDFTFTLAVLLWPVVILWAKWQWQQKYGG